MTPRVDQPPGGRLLAASVLAVALGVGSVALFQLPGPLVTPALGMLLVISGFTLAAGSYLKGLRMQKGGSGVGNYEVAGALAFLGFAAALMTDAEQALALLAEMETRG
jgi:hypothetical protein